MERIVKRRTSIPGVLFLLILILPLLFVAWTAGAAEPIPLELKDIGIEPQLGKTIPLGLSFTNEDGKPVVSDVLPIRKPPAASRPRPAK